MEKVKVSQEVAEALDDLFSRKSDKYSKDEILKMHFNALHGDRWSGGNEDYLNELSMSEMAQAMFVGYEVEQTPAEKVKEYFDGWNPTIDNISSSDWTSEQKAIIGTLNRLNIKIKGVNA